MSIRLFGTARHIKMKKLVWILSVIFAFVSVQASGDVSDIFGSLFSSSSSSNAQSRVLTLPIVTLQGKHKPIILSRLDVSVKIAGPIAQTSYEMVFYNPNERILEGELKLPLLGGQSVVGYALDMDGVYRESVVVDKAKAKKAFEDTIRRNIDPGIIEKTIGNNYKLRLYPLPAKGYKKVRVTVEELLSEKKNRYRYRLPFVSSKKIPDFSLHIEIESSDTPVVQLSGPMKGQVFDRKETGYFLEYQKRNMKLSKPIVLSIERRDHHQVYFQKSRGKNANWFMAVLPVDRSGKKSLFSQDEKYETIGIIWDTSLSSGKSDKAKDLAFLDRFFAQHKGTTYRVELKTLDLSLHSQGSFRVAGGEWGRLKKRLETLRYNGAKDLSKLRIDKNTRFTFLFSNGINTFSDDVAVSKGRPVIAINSSTGSDSDTMRYIAKKSGGNYLDLSQMGIDDAIIELDEDDTFRIRKHSKSLYDIYTKKLGERMIVLGRMKGRKGSFTYQMGDQEQKVSILESAPSDLISRVWAGAKIEYLSMRSRQNKKQIIALSKKYRIVSKYTSMIVLESIEDYVRYEIVPPKPMRKQYDALLKKKKQEKKSEREQAIQEAVSLLKEQKIWYRSKFPLSKKEIQDNGRCGMGGDIAPVEEPAPAPSAQRQSSAKKKAAAQKGKTSSQPKIALKAWQSNAAYLNGLDSLSKKQLLDRYFELRKTHRNEPAFYIDMADYFRKRGLKKESLLILSNLLELDFENSEFIRVFAFKLQEYHLDKTSIFFFAKVRELRPFEPQSTRDLALSYERAGRYQRALNLHYFIITHNWHGRFGGSKIVTINEMNHLIMKHRLNTSRIDRRLIARMPVDIRIVINWSTDNTDMDLWVIDPEGIKTFYGNRVSKNGGKISNDMTRGYGPEEFMLKKALKGAYQIKVKYYGTSQQKLTGPTVIRAEVYTGYGKKREKREDIVFRVEEEKEVIDLGEIVY